MKLIEDKICTSVYLKNSAGKYPNKIYVRDNKTTITYKDMEDRANSLALMLNSMGISPSDRIALYFENSTVMILSIWGILKNASIFVPLPYDAPATRLQAIVNNCSPAMIVTTRENEETIENICSLRIIYVEDYALFDLSQNTYPRYPYYCQCHDTKDHAYIIYTSGSTGEPKGVMIRHESLMNYTETTVDDFSFNEETKSLCLSPLYFDGALGSIFYIAKTGGTLLLHDISLTFPRIVLRSIIQNEITHIGCTPSLFVALIEYIRKNSYHDLKLKTVGLGGDVVPKSSIRELKACYPTIRIFNRYGPTETTIIVSGYEINESDLENEDDIPIGLPNNNSTFYVLDDEFEEVGVKEVGELYIGGIQVMTGYWNDPKLTSEKIFENLIDNERIYRTGDYVYKNSGGLYVYVSRTQDYVKRHGYRIYLSEIEKILNRNRTVKESAIIYQDDILIAFVSANDEYDENCLNEELKNCLPTYMIPNHIVILQEMPHTTVGKIDKQYLSKEYKHFL
ncbi:MAG: amino acid adenylation domain-containing protein [Clostridium sp.]|jgi:amino acid adenylation domain-containing protein|nr:amino acid adenylation domain-containing protein [Clostridium sp.]